MSADNWNLFFTIFLFVLFYKLWENKLILRFIATVASLFVPGALVGGVISLMGFLGGGIRIDYDYISPSKMFCIFIVCVFVLVLNLIVVGIIDSIDSSNSSNSSKRSE